MVKGRSIMEITIVVLTLMLLPGSQAASQANPPKTEANANLQQCSWNIVDDIVDTGDTTLTGVAYLSPKDIWIVGWDNNPLTEHWNGVVWTVYPPAEQNPNIVLHSISAISPTDIWAVGTDLGAYRTVTEHWNGISWSLVPSPNPSTDASLYGVAAISPIDIWAVGTYMSITYGIGWTKTLVEHWNGLMWSVIPSPNPPLPPSPGLQNSSLWGISAVSSNDIWAVGHYDNANAGASNGSLTLHWNGIAWSSVVNFTDGVVRHLYAVAALSHNNVWAAGYDLGEGIEKTLTPHWDGMTWQRISGVNPGSWHNEMYAMVAISTTSIWAVGYFDDGTGGRTLAEQWNGSAWGRVPIPIEGDYAQLNAIAAKRSATGMHGDDMWAVGDWSILFSISHPLVEHYSCSNTRLVQLLSSSQGDN